MIARIALVVKLALPKETLINRRNTGFASAVITIFLLFSSPTYAQTAKAVAAKAFPSLVLLVIQDGNGQPISLGSGFYVGSGLVATNVHVISGGASGTAKIIGRKETLSISGVAALDRANDLAILEVKGVAGPVLPLADSDKIAVGDEIFAVGNPQGLEGTISQGIVSAVRKLAGRSILQITAPISPGSSGGPVLDASGHVVGIAVASYRGGQNLNFAIPSNHLARLLSQPRSSLALSTIKPPSAGAAASMGGKGGEGVVATNLVCVPDMAFLGEFNENWRCSFSLVNKLKSPVSRVRYLVILYSKDGQPLDTKEGSLPGPIRPGLALRPVEGTSPSPYSFMVPTAVKRISARTEIRVLDYIIAE